MNARIENAWAWHAAGHSADDATMVAALRSIGVGLRSDPGSVRRDETVRSGPVAQGMAANQPIAGVVTADLAAEGSTPRSVPALTDDGAPTDEMHARLRAHVSADTGIEPVEPGARWPWRRPALVVAPDASWFAAIARTGRRRSVVIGPDGRRCRVLNRSLAGREEPFSGVSNRAARAFADLRGQGDPRHRPLVVTFTDLSRAAGSRRGRMGLIVALAVATFVTTVAMLTSWAYAFGAVETGDTGDLVPAIGAAVVAAAAQGASVLVASRLATFWSLTMRSRVADQVLAADPRRTRATGELALLAHLSEAENLDSTSIETALRAASGVTGLALALLLAATTFPLALVPALGLWLVALVAAARLYRGSNDRIASARRETGGWVAEQLRSHETRWVQSPDTDMSPQAARMADRYDAVAARVDRAEWLLSFAVPAAGLAVAIATAGTVAGVTGSDAGRTAAAIASVLIAYQAVTTIAVGLASAVRVRSARAGLAEVLAAPSEGEAFERQGAGDDPDPGIDQHWDALDAAVAGPRARVLLHGPTGSGKSRALDAFVARSRSVDPRRGDAPTLVPAFADNFVFRDSLTYNLLMGRGWPATATEIARAEQVARSVGLGDLIDRMPIGMDTPVGETGWQLSNGERTMVFLARGLLSGDGTLLVDDSLDAIDEQRRGRVEDALAAHPGAVVRTEAADGPSPIWERSASETSGTGST